MDMGDVERFLASHPYSTATMDTYRRVLRALVNLPKLEQLDAAGLLAWVKGHTAWGNSQQYVGLCACRIFLAWGFGVNHPALSARIKRIRPRRQRVLSPARALDLLACFDPRTPKGARDLAIAALGLDAGLRSSEFCRLMLADVDLEACTLQVIVKGGQRGVGVFSPETAEYISAWISVRSAAPGVGNLFVSTYSGRRSRVTD